MSGLLAAIRLQQAGIPFTVIEKNAGCGRNLVGEHAIPAPASTSGNHFYCYSFEPDDHWTEFFARQPELQAYFQGVMERHGITEHVRFNTRVTRATWDERRPTWSVLVIEADDGTDRRP